ncbi:hypothetical protein ACSBR2_002346 [Camellia fascicularis]
MVVMIEGSPESEKGDFGLEIFDLAFELFLGLASFLIALPASAGIAWLRATGMFRGNRYILGWSFNKSGQAQSLDISKLPSLLSKRKPRHIPSLEIIVSLIMVSIVLIVIILGIVYNVSSKKYEEILEDWEQEYGPQRFFYNDLYKATNGFKDEELLGGGGFGKVYKGVLTSSKEQVTVKKISHDSKQGVKEFVAEIASMGNLDKFKFGNEKPTLNWAQRYQILRGVAYALQYLHEEWEKVVLYKDVRASNDLLDADINGWLEDFGLARLILRSGNKDQFLRQVILDWAVIILVLKLGMLCSQYNEAARPSMRQVMQYLDGNTLWPNIPLDIAVVANVSD